MDARQLPAFKKDAYMKRRGTPVMVKIFCAGCDGYIMHYQKDGPGPLKRCYLDRIHLPQVLEQRQYDEFDKKASPQLICEQCETVIGSPIIYEKENRPAYHMRQGFFAKRTCKG